jgi:hypothetical protein
MAHLFPNPNNKLCHGSLVSSSSAIVGCLTTTVRKRLKTTPNPRQPETVSSLLGFDKLMEKLKNWKPDYKGILLRIQKLLRLEPFYAFQNYQLKIAA